MRPGSRKDGVKVVSQVNVAGEVADELDCEVVSDVVLAEDKEEVVVVCEEEKELVAEFELVLLRVLEVLELLVDVVLVETVEEVDDVPPLRAANAPTAIMMTTIITIPIIADLLIAWRNRDLNRDIK
jgi:hypothetical protein